MNHMNKRISLEEAIAKIQDGQTIMIGGFLAVGTPERLVDALVASGKKDLTIIANDTSYVDRGIGKLIANDQAKKVIASHIGTNKEMGNQLNSGETEVILTPQGTLAEQIRAAGAGLGGVLTKTGLSTKVEEGKEKIDIDGETYLLEKPLRADVALIFASKADEFGNAVYRGSTQNFNLVMAMAADTVIMEPLEIVPVGEIDQNDVRVPGIFVDYLVEV